MQIGAGSIVTKDIPDNVVAVGNPCRIIREVGEHGGEEIKAMADYVTDDVDNGGLYNAFVHFGLV